MYVLWNIYILYLCGLYFYLIRRLLCLGPLNRTENPNSYFYKVTVEKKTGSKFWNWLLHHYTIQDRWYFTQRYGIFTTGRDRFFIFWRTLAYCFIFNTTLHLYAIHIIILWATSGNETTNDLRPIWPLLNFGTQTHKIYLTATGHSPDLVLTCRSFNKDDRFQRGDG